MGQDPGHYTIRRRLGQGLGSASAARPRRLLSSAHSCASSGPRSLSKLNKLKDLAAVSQLVSPYGLHVVAKSIVAGHSRAPRMAGMETTLASLFVTPAVPPRTACAEPFPRELPPD